jgi:hypothetical protein
MCELAAGGGHLDMLIWMRQEHGTAVQVEPMKPMSKALGTKRLKPKYHKLRSSFAFNFNLRH